MFRMFNKNIFYRTTLRLTPAVVIPFFKQNNENDYNLLEKSDQEAPITGWERVKRMYSKNEYEEFSIEIHNIAQASMSGIFFGACYGGFIKSRDAYLYFIENNQAAVFNSTFQAKVNFEIILLYCSLIATTISVYRDKNSVIEYMIAGAVTGAVYKANLGLAASLVGAGLGTALSLVGGLAIIGLLKISGVTMNDIRQSLYKIKQSREQVYNECLEASAKEKNDDLTKHHDVLIVEKGIKKIEEIV
ncbi:RPII140-upstream gene protein [Zerene cesonia]|uniref:RPII140-upstream gene protein n=1 Tax=Zerene cesonia TaxID=33412 RepID=UPI0018E58715|nr:RPII140-upstream gene protein [Zerene cesonia]